MKYTCTQKSSTWLVIPDGAVRALVRISAKSLWSVDDHGLTPKLIFLSDSGAIAETSTTSRQQQQQQLGLLDRWLGPEAIPSSPGACMMHVVGRPTPTGAETWTRD